MTYDRTPARAARRSDIAFGAWSMLGDALAVEALGKSGADFVGLDVQHGFFGFEQCVRGIQILDLLGVPSLIRISCTERHKIPRYLDAGADRIMLAMVTSAAEVRGCLDLARYQPRGHRSYGGQRHGLRAEPANPAEAEPLVYVMIETAPALNAVAEIAATPGIAGLFVGPVDLGLAIGAPPSLSDSRFSAALREVIAAAQDNAIAVGMFVTDGASAAEVAPLGFSEIVISSDIAQLRSAMASEISRAADIG